MSSIGFRGFLAAAAGLASVAGIGVAGYQLAQSDSDSGPDNLEIRIQNSLESVITELPQEKREEAQELLGPISKLVTAAGGEDDEAIVKAKTSISDALVSKSLVSYHADKSPFVPPLNKVQFLCGEEFLLTYTNPGRTMSTFRIGTQKESLGELYLQPGQVKSVESDETKLTLTILEYREELKGPLLKYSCGF